MSGIGGGENTLTAIATQGAKGWQGFYLSILFTPEGMVESLLAGNVFKSLWDEQPQILGEGRIGLFRSLEEIQRFCFILGEKLGCSQINILNNHDFAQALSSSQNREELKKALASTGHILEIPKTLSRKSFLGNFFNLKSS